MRLWLPELFTMVSENEQSADLCSMIMSSVNKSVTNLEGMTNDENCIDMVCIYVMYIDICI